MNTETEILKGYLQAIEAQEIASTYDRHSPEFQNAFHQATGGWL